MAPSVDIPASPRSDDGLPSLTLKSLNFRDAAGTTFDSPTSPLSPALSPGENAAVTTCALDLGMQTGEASELLKSLPAETYRSQQFFDLEHRAIFSKCWLLATHTSRFKEAGDFVSLEYGGFPFFIIRTREGKYNAFHNSCRHRAYPLMHKPQGNVKILACRYHSWSYRQDGSLAKAPKFENEPNFKKEENGLFPVHLHITDKGFMFVNFSAGEPVPFKDHFGALPEEWKELPVDDYEYAYSWSVTGRYNWKTLMDGYQECYHCQIGHPGFAKTLDLNQYKVVPFTNFARHVAPYAKSSEAPPTFTFVFPTSGVTTTPTMWYMMRTCPVGPNETRMEYDVFRRKRVPMPELREFMKFYEAVEQEDFDLCEATQRSLNVGVYSKGTLHPSREIGVLYYQQRVLDFCMEHFEEEKKVGHDIDPARPASQQHGDECAASKLCSSLSSEKGPLAW